MFFFFLTGETGAGKKSTLCGIPIAGLIISANGDRYWGLILCTALCFAGSLASFVAARVIAVGWGIKTIY